MLAHYLESLDGIRADIDKALEAKDFDQLAAIDDQVKALVRALSDDKVISSEDKSLVLSRLNEVYDVLLKALARFKNEVTQQVANMHQNKKGIKAYRQ